jgi:peptide chain release factor subunit 1
MSELDQGLLRKLAAWDAGLPITSVYLTVDGRRYPRKTDYELRLDELLRHARMRTNDLDRDAARSVERDVATMSEFVRDEFDRGDAKGLAMFSSNGAGLWEVVRVSRPVRDRAVVAPEADLVPLEALVETYRPTGVALVDFEKARLFVVDMGRIDEVTDLWDEVPGRHDQGGWAQMRMQRHVDDHRARHIKHVADVLFELWRRTPFEHLALAGAQEAQHELESALHDYLRRRVRARFPLPVTASRDEVLERVVQLEENVERDRERDAVERLSRAAATDERGVIGLEETLRAVSEARVDELVVSFDLSAPGAVCGSCGRLSTREGRCPTCGERAHAVPDVVESAVAAALRTGSKVEVVLDGGLQDLGGIGALLRF